MDEKNKTWTIYFPPKENPNTEKALFDSPIVLQYEVKVIYRKFFGHKVFPAERSLKLRLTNQKPGVFESVR